MAQDDTPHEKLAQLRERLGLLSKEELRDLCFDLGVKYDDLGGEGAAAKARELIDYLERHCRIPELESASDCELYQRQTMRPAVPGVDATDREIDKLVASRELPKGAVG
jgi:hypothetical protein